MENAPQISGPMTTAQSAIQGRLKVDVGSKKKKIVKNAIKKVKC